MANKKTGGDKTPSNKKKSKRQVVQPLPEPNLLPKMEQINIEHLFSQALLRYKQEELSDKKQKHKEVNHLALMAEEYLSCFVMLGFSLQGEKVCMFTAPTSKDEGALVDLLRSTFFDLANNRP